MLITKKGFTRTRWDSATREHVDDPIIHIFNHIRDGCVIEEGVTLKDIIRLIVADPDLKKLIAGYASCDVDAFWEQVQKPGVRLSDLRYIEIHRFITIQKELKSSKTGEVYTKSGEVEQHVNVGGVGPDIDGDYGEKGAVMHWAIDFTDVSELAHTPVKLTGVTVSDEREFIDGVGYKEISSADTDGFTLLEVLGELMWELSFHGSPRDIADTSLTLRGMVDDIKSGKAQTVPYRFEGEEDEETVQ